MICVRRTLIYELFSKVIQMISPKKEIKNKMNPFLIWMSTVPKERLINSQYYSLSTLLLYGEFLLIWTVIKCKRKHINDTVDLLWQRYAEDTRISTLILEALLESPIDSRKVTLYNIKAYIELMTYISLMLTLLWIQRSTLCVCFYSSDEVY